MPIELPTAVILAAGVARRLAPLTDRTQKSLLPVGGRPILARMLDALAAAGVPRAVIVVGHCADQVAALTAGAPPGMTVRVPAESRTTPGARPISLHAARDVITGALDAHHGRRRRLPREFLRRLLAARAANALLIDRGFQDTGEEVKLYTRA